MNVRKALAVSLSSLASLSALAAFSPQHPVVAGEVERTQSAASPHTTGKPEASRVAWQQWSDDIFKRAAQEKKLVILDLEAVWCHWCHVMDEKTYNDPEVARIINSKFIAVKVDQDSRPDLSNKYEEYGWPATIFFNWQGGELAKRSGFIEPDEMKALIKRLVANPDKVEDGGGREVTYSSHDALPEAARKDLIARHILGYDQKCAGWGTHHKFLDWDSLEYSLILARQGDADARKRVVETLKAHSKLIDPVWGGVYQYSTHGDWDHPHFEKIMQTQAENLRLYALASMVLNQRSYSESAEKIAGYLNNFLKDPGGAFYTSQDADLKPGEHSQEYFDLKDEERRAKGIPRIDRHIYSRENGWAIAALAYLYMATGKAEYLKSAETAARWIIENRSLAGGGFSHDAKDRGGPFLGDTLGMGRAFIALYQATADGKWLDRAEQAASFIDSHFGVAAEGASAAQESPAATAGGKRAGYLTARQRPNVVPAPEPLLEENQMLARFANLLFHYTGKRKYEEIARQSMRYLATPHILAKRRILVAGTLMADYELTHPPAHITVVGSKSDRAARDLYMAAIRSPNVYKRIDWLDKKEGTLPNLDVEFPDLPKSAAFVCLGNRCSTPAYQPDQLTSLLSRSER